MLFILSNLRCESILCLVGCVVFSQICDVVGSNLTTVLIASETTQKHNIFSVFSFTQDFHRYQLMSIYQKREKVSLFVFLLMALVA